MNAALVRKARQVFEDPVLRRWLCRRLVGLEKSPAGFTVGRPPYLRGALPDEAPQGPVFPASRFSAPANSLEFALPGETVTLEPGNPDALFERQYVDLETLLAAHRFAWVPLAGSGVEADWVDALWRIWSDRFGADRTGWPWHAYTTAERAINIIDFARGSGLPGDPDATAGVLAAHAAVIRDNLEYFGDHYTSNHLSNNGRGLLRIGTALGMPEAARTGAEILIAEAGRIFGRSGVLREGSTHYHLLLTRNYIDAWLDADGAGLDQAPLLRDIAARAVAVVPTLMLPGGVPLIGDISPDSPPGYLYLTSNPDPTVLTWTEGLAEDARRKLRLLVDQTNPVSSDRLSEDGWHRFGSSSWEVLTFAPPDGWPPMPGHGHHDLGSFELHDHDVPIIVDPGRGSYADTEYESATWHSGISIDGHGPTPVNRPHYADDFRRRVVPSAPDVIRLRDGRCLTHAGFARISGLGDAHREWRFDDAAVSIRDRIEGSGNRRIQRRLFVAGDVIVEDDFALLRTGKRTYRISGGPPPTTQSRPRWTAYGESRLGTVILFDQSASLPFESLITIERA